MQTTKPQTDRVYLIVRDAETGRSKTLTLYNTTFDETVQWLRARLDESSENDPNPQGGDVDGKTG